MPAAPAPIDEDRRLAALTALGILDSPHDPDFDAIVRVAAFVCGTPIAAISLIDQHRQWFLAQVGLGDVRETPRDAAFCAHAILEDDLLEVSDATEDARFADNPLVLGQPDIRFYAGVPLSLDGGSRIGTLCVIDQAPRHLDPERRAALRDLAQVAVRALESWRMRREQAQTLADLRASEARLRRIYEATPAMLHSLDADAKVLTVSDAWLERLGYTRDEVIGRPAQTFLTADSFRAASAVGRPILFSTGRCDKIELQLVTKTGEVVDVLYSAIIDGKPDGRPQGRLAVLEEVTEQRRAERALAEERQRLSHLVEGAGVGTWETNVQTGTVRVDERWARILGYTAAELGTLTIDALRELRHPDDRTRSDEVLQAHITGQNDRFEFEGRLRHRDEHWVWVQSRGAVMTRTADGAPERMFGSSADITARKLQEEALRKSEDFLLATGRLGGVGGWELDLVTGTVDWTAETRTLHGVGPDYRPTVAEAIDFYAPEAQPVIRAAVDRAIVEGRSWDLELPLVRADGRRIWARAVGSAVFADGKPVRLQGAFQDVTDRVDERLALQTAQNRIALATGSGGIGIWDWDLATNVITPDAQRQRLYGLSSDSGPVPFADWQKYIHPEDAALTRTALQDALAGLTPYNIEFRIVWNDGSVHHLKSAAHVIRDPAGQAVRMVGVAWDVTESRTLAAERDRHAARLAESEAELRLLFHSITGCAIYRLDPDGLVTSWSIGAERTKGYRASEIVGRHFSIIMSPEDQAAKKPQTALAVARTTGQFSEEGWHIRKDGSRFRAALIIEPIRNDTGTLVGYVSITHDISERYRSEQVRAELQAHTRQAQEDAEAANANLQRLTRHLARARDVAERANRAKSHFLAGMSHELRTPLNGILGYAQLLRQEGELNDLQASRVAAMMAAGSHLLEMINSVLDMSEIEAEHMEVRAVDVDAKAVAAACLDLVRPGAVAKALALGMAVAPGAPTRLVTDPMRLRQVLLNLLGNAVKFTPSGTIEIRLRNSADGGALRIEVVDTGPGIPPAHRQRLFHDFERLQNEANGTIEGSGLGLALSARLAKLMGGKLGLDDNPAGGSVFWLELPVSVASPVLPVSEAPGRAAAPAPAQAATLRVLVVDDVAMNRDIARSFLKLAGHTVTCAENAAQAVTAVADETFDVVLMDVRMPGVDGLEATRRIRALPGDRGRVPVIGLTAQAFAEQVDSCRQAGMDGHLAKPYSQEALLAVVAGAAGSLHDRRGPGAAVARSPSGSGSAPSPEGASDAAIIGSDLPVVDTQAAGRLAEYLDPPAIASYLQTIGKRCEALLGDLRGPDALADASGALADATHTLAGSAGMLGFARLASVGLRLEQALRARAADAPALAAGMQAAIEATVDEIRCVPAQGAPTLADPMGASR